MTVTKPRLPCVSYGQKNYIPCVQLVMDLLSSLLITFSMEFVKILPFNSIPMRSLSAEQTADMIKVAAKRPDERMGMS